MMLIHNSEPLMKERCMELYKAYLPSIRNNVSNFEKDEGISYEGEIERPQESHIEETEGSQNSKKRRFKRCRDVIQEIEDFVDQHERLMDAYFDGLKRLKGQLKCMQATSSEVHSASSFTKVDDGFGNSLLRSKPFFEKGHKRSNITTHHHFVFLKEANGNQCKKS